MKTDYIPNELIKECGGVVLVLPDSNKGITDITSKDNTVKVDKTDPAKPDLSVAFNIYDIFHKEPKDIDVKALSDFVKIDLYQAIESKCPTLPPPKHDFHWCNAYQFVAIDNSVSPINVMFPSNTDPKWLSSKVDWKTVLNNEKIRSITGCNNGYVILPTNEDKMPEGFDVLLYTIIGNAEYTMPVAIKGRPEQASILLDVAFDGTYYYMLSYNSKGYDYGIVKCDYDFNFVSYTIPWITYKPQSNSANQITCCRGDVILIASTENTDPKNTRIWAIDAKTCKVKKARDDSEMSVKISDANVESTCDGKLNMYVAIADKAGNRKVYSLPKEPDTAWDLSRFFTVPAQVPCEMTFIGQYLVIGVAFGGDKDQMLIFDLTDNPKELTISHTIDNVIWNYSGFMYGGGVPRMHLCGYYIDIPAGFSWAIGYLGRQYFPYKYPSIWGVMTGGMRLHVDKNPHIASLSGMPFSLVDASDNIVASGTLDPKGEAELDDIFANKYTLKIQNRGKDYSVCSVVIQPKTITDVAFTVNISVDWTEITSKPATFTPSTHTHKKTEVGLDNVDNTADKDKPVSTAQQKALDGKEPTIPSGKATDYIGGDKKCYPLPTPSSTDADARTALEKINNMTPGTFDKAKFVRMQPYMLGDFINVLDFGAKGNGTDDDADAFQATINYVQTNGGIVYVPYRTYKIGKTLNIGKNIKFTGEIINENFYSYLNFYNMANINTKSTTCTNIVFSNLGFGSQGGPNEMFVNNNPNLSAYFDTCYTSVNWTISVMYITIAHCWMHATINIDGGGDFYYAQMTGQVISKGKVSANYSSFSYDNSSKGGSLQFSGTTGSAAGSSIFCCGFTRISATNSQTIFALNSYYSSSDMPAYVTWKPDPATYPRQAMRQVKDFPVLQFTIPTFVPADGMIKVADFPVATCSPEKEIKKQGIINRFLNWCCK